MNARIQSLGPRLLFGLFFQKEETEAASSRSGSGTKPWRRRVVWKRVAEERKAKAEAEAKAQAKASRGNARMIERRKEEVTASADAEEKADDNL